MEIQNELVLFSLANCGGALGAKNELVLFSLLYCGGVLGPKELFVLSPFSAFVWGVLWGLKVGLSSLR